jgi:hypothetical protein
MQRRTAVDFTDRPCDDPLRWAIAERNGPEKRREKERKNKKKKTRGKGRPLGLSVMVQWQIVRLPACPTRQGLCFTNGGLALGLGSRRPCNCDEFAILGNERSHTHE